MIYKTLTKALLVAGLAIGASTAAYAEKPKLMMGASAKMLADTCYGCHGTDGASGGPATPTISGLSKDYFVETMEGFAEDEIPSTIMGRIAKGYTKDEIKMLADYFGDKPFVKAKQGFDAKLAKKGKKLHKKYCEKCHADGGSTAEDDAGILAGQWTPYLTWQFADFKAGEREAPKKMRKKMKKMLSREGSAGLEALINYYASQQK
ncbi:MAG TPA: cytochrome c4 [Sedimenticola thiotaurini]|uniref:Cytochrome c4 n=1 Tax=Sedimenticola thiotaurini TaxID=1543721 RepID=A0A831RNC7_9GAMM|nr:cytochrome c4 [Sedimenticola thiotaurini]